MNSASDNSDDAIDFSEISGRIFKGLGRSIGLGCIGLTLGIVISLLLSYKQPVTTTTRVTFGFPGFERGTYPNGTKFQADDVRAPDVINEAVKRLGLDNKAAELSSVLRGAIVINGFVSSALVKERDRLRAAGQIVPPLIPDEYEISLSLPRDHTLAIRQRELLMAEIVSAYRAKFLKTYVEVPAAYENAFASLSDADFVEYELVLTKATQALAGYLEQQVLLAKQFRSPTNNLSFNDLLKQTELFPQIQMSEVLGLIYLNGLTKNREISLAKMDYFIRTLEDQELRLKEEESVVANLLSKTQERERAQNYVLVSKSQMPQNGQPIIDQNFIDTLLANDAYNFLVRKALAAGLAAKRIQADKIFLTDRRQRVSKFSDTNLQDKTEHLATFDKSLKKLSASYEKLLANVQICMNDFSKQEYSDAVRISMQAKTESVLRSLLIGAFMGAAAGFSLGLGLSLLNSRPERSNATGVA